MEHEQNQDQDTVATLVLDVLTLTVIFAVFFLWLSYPGVKP